MTETAASPTVSARRAVRRWFRPLSEVRTWSSQVYLGLSFPLGLFWFITSVVLGSVGLALILLWVGIPILLVLFFAWRLGAQSERWLARQLVGTPIVEPYRPTPSGGWIVKARAIVSDPASWRDPLYLLLRFPLGIVWFVVQVSVWAATLGLVAAPIVVAGGESYQFVVDGNGESWIEIDRWWEAAMAAAVGIIALPVAARATVLAAGAQAGLARALLSPVASSRLREEVSSLIDRRDRGIEAVAAERRRIERDLHDGAQQRLVGLAMDLGRARHKLDSDDPDGARDLLDGAHSSAKQALSELRDLARGIHPAILSDRGLDAALSSLAARSTVPVEVDYRPDRRLPETTESIGYFVVAEALTNVSKHADATRAWVTVRELTTDVLIEVEDDGVGGADAEGGGLVGLADRVAAAGGRFDVFSPPGGPTVIRAEVPCAS